MVRREMNPPATASRLDHVDGLRAIAVALVVWFHAQLPGAPQGYLGVDVFFVISGFLITGQIFDAVERGTFSIADFYARRVVRILPPLLLVIASVLIAASVLHIMPGDTRRIAISAVASAAMVPNWYFLSKTDYFAVAAEREPLLHLWSLGVEEQYYLVAPAVAMLIGSFALKRGKSVYKLGLIVSAAALLLSFAAAFAFMKSKAALVFFGTPIRAWEFGAGACAILAMRLGMKLPRASAGAIAMTGVVFIIAASAWNANTPLTRFGSQVAVVAGTVAAIAGCMFAPHGIATRLLSARLMVGIGLISYSFYLWHWPGLALWRLTHLDPPSHTASVVLGIIVPLALAIITYLAVELPLRRWRQRQVDARFKLRIIARGLAASVAIGVIGLGAVIWTYRLDQSPRYRPFAEATALLMPDCRKSIGDGRTPPECRVGNEGELRVLLWGDSHALSLSAAVHDAARSARQSAQVEWTGGCPAIVGTPLYFGGSIWTKCVRRNEAVLRWLQSADQASATGVVIGGAFGFNFGHPPLGLGRAGDIAHLQNAITVTLQRLQALGLRVLVVGPVPATPYFAPECVFLTSIANRRTTCDATRSAAVDQFGDVSAALRRATAKFPNARFIDPFAALCEEDRCPAAFGTVINYSDTNHLTDGGSRRVLQRYRDDFSWVFGATERERN